MLSEEEIRERARYCFCVYKQLFALEKNELISPVTYLDYLQKSSLQLGDDEFIRAVIQEGLLMGEEDGGLSDLIHMYEGFTRAYCDVLEVELEEIVREIPPDFLEQLAEEVHIKRKD